MAQAMLDQLLPDGPSGKGPRHMKKAQKNAPSQPPEPECSSSETDCLLVYCCWDICSLPNIKKNR